MRTFVTSLVLLASVIEVLLLVLSLKFNARHHTVESICCFLALSLFYLVSCYWVLKFSANEGQSHPGWIIIVSAIVFRMTVWPLFPAFSDDAFRYRWEGKLQAAGGNPYQVRPEDANWANLRDATYPNVVAKDFKAGYGPLIELVELWNFRAVSLLVKDPFAQVFWFKLPATLCDLGIMAALWALLIARGLPIELILIYAWSPLPIIEFWATGHNDAVPVFFVMLALFAAARDSWTWAFVWLSLATTAKFWPLLLFPLFVRQMLGAHSRTSWRHLVPVLPIAAIACWPYRSDIIENARFMTGFVGGWRNNDSLFGALLWLTGDLFRAKYLAFALIAGVVAAMTVIRWPLERAALVALAATLMISANCHPWYLTWILPLLVFTPSVPLLLWTALIPLAYSVLIEWFTLGEWHGSTGMRWLIYVPVYGLLCAKWISARISKRGIG